MPSETLRFRGIFRFFLCCSNRVAALPVRVSRKKNRRTTEVGTFSGPYRRRGLVLQNNGGNDLVRLLQCAFYLLTALKKGGKLQRTSPHPSVGQAARSPTAPVRSARTSRTRGHLRHHAYRLFGTVRSYRNRTGAARNNGGNILAISPTACVHLSPPRWPMARPLQRHGCCLTHPSGIGNGSPAAPGPCSANVTTVAVQFAEPGRAPPWCSPPPHLRLHRRRQTVRCYGANRPLVLAEQRAPNPIGRSHRPTAPSTFSPAALGRWERITAFTVRAPPSARWRSSPTPAAAIAERQRSTKRAWSTLRSRRPPRRLWALAFG